MAQQVERPKHERAIDRAVTLFEQVKEKGTEFKHEDEKFKYLLAPISDEVHLTQYFREGYEPAPDHPMNDGINVVLRVNRDYHRKKYDEACRRVLEAVQDTSSDRIASGDEDGLTKSTSQFGKPEPIEELVKRLPDEEDES